MVSCEVADGENDLKLGIEREKRLEEVLLAPEHELLFEPAMRVLEGEEDVMDVHDHTLVEPGERLEVEVIHVASAPHDMRGVDRQDVVLS